MQTNDTFILKFDGCSKGNPGQSGAGAVIYNNDKEIWSGSVFVGEKCTNNYAEYSGLILGMKKAVELNIKSLCIQGDSMLVINQMDEFYSCKSSNLIGLYNEAKILEGKIDRIQYKHIRRHLNKRADELANLSIISL